MPLTAENILDVTIIDPRLKHPAIFQYFDELASGKTLEIHNDHDPRPLYYQLLHERGPIFEWEYVEAGPVWWKVRITKRGAKGTALDDVSVGEVLAKDIRKALVFKKYGIDFCCGGKNTIGQVCKEKGIDQQQLEQELTMQSHSHERAMDYSTWELDFLADFIVKTHHRYVQDTLPELITYSRKVAGVHSQSHQELIPIMEKIEQLNDELTYHMAKEENILFPYIKRMVAAQRSEREMASAAFGSVDNPIRFMESEHDTAGKLLGEIRELTGQYQVPADACNSYTLLYRLLEEFENDLHIHIHLENNILFPKAIELETKMAG